MSKNFLLAGLLGLEGLLFYSYNKQSGGNDEIIDEIKRRINKNKGTMYILQFDKDINRILNIQTDGPDITEDDIRLYANMCIGQEGVITMDNIPENNIITVATGNAYQCYNKDSLIELFKNDILDPYYRIRYNRDQIHFIKYGKENYIKPMKEWGSDEWDRNIFDLGGLKWSIINEHEKYCNEITKNKSWADYIKSSFLFTDLHKWMRTNTPFDPDSTYKRGYKLGIMEWWYFKIYNCGYSTEPDQYELNNFNIWKKNVIKAISYGTS